MGNDTNLRRRKRRTAPTAARVEFLPQRCQCDVHLYTALMKENMYFLYYLKVSLYLQMYNFNTKMLAALLSKELEGGHSVI